MVGPPGIITENTMDKPHLKQKRGRQSDTLSITTAEQDSLARNLGLGSISIRNLNDYKELGDRLTKAGAIQVARGRYLASMAAMDEISKIVDGALKQTSVVSEQFIPLARLAVDTHTRIAMIASRIELSEKTVPTFTKERLLTPCFPPTSVKEDKAQVPILTITEN